MSLDSVEDMKPQLCVSQPPLEHSHSMLGPNSPTKPSYLTNHRAPRWVSTIYV